MALIATDMEPEFNNEEEDSIDEETTSESERADDYTRQLAQRLTTREKIMVLLCRVRNSGLFNMMTETGEAAMAALYFGVYVGLLRYPSDFYDSEIMRLDQVYQRWFALSFSRGAIVDVNKEPYHWYQRHENFSQKSRPFGPLERGHKEFDVYEGMAAMMPFGDEYNAMMRRQSVASASWNAPKPVGHLLDAAEALRVAIFVMEWVGEEVYQTNLENEGQELAKLSRQNAIDMVPEVSTTGKDQHQVDRRYGLTQFAVFIASETNRAEIIRAVKRKLHLVIDLRAVEKVQGFKASFQCKQCALSSVLARKEVLSGLIFCTLNCQREFHRHAK